MLKEAFKLRIRKMTKEKRSKEKQYKITYERKIEWYNFVPQFGISLLLLFPLLKFENLGIIKLYLDNLDTTIIGGLVFIGILAWILTIYFILVSGIINVYHWIKQQEDGTINKEEVYFTGNLKSIEEVIQPKEVKQKVKFKTIYKND